MRYADFAGIMAAARMERYRTACNGNPQKAMTLYRKKPETFTGAVYRY